MEDQSSLYTVSIYSENNIGLLNRISAIFQRRHINIESINVSVSEIPNVSRWTLVVYLDETLMKKIIGQIEKQVEVIRAFYHTESDTYYQESCLVKLKAEALTSGELVANLIEENHARLVTVNTKFCVLEKSGSTNDIDRLHDYLAPYGIMQFVRTGRIAITKNEMNISSLLNGEA